MSKRRLPGPAGMSGMVSLWGASSLIRSVQYGSISIASGQTNTAAITAVDTANSVLRFYGNSTTYTGVDPDVAQCSVALTNSTTVTAKRGHAGAFGTTTCKFAVVEYAPGVLKSIQRGKTNVSNAGTLTATITAVDTAKTSLMWLGTEMDGNPYRNDYENANATLTNATTITFSVGYVGGALPYQWQVEEYF